MKRAHGFSLIEMMLVLVIVGIMVAVALPSMRLHLANSDIRALAEEMRSGVELARVEALRRNSTARFIRSGSGWTVVVPGAGTAGADLTVASRAQRDTGATITADIDAINFNGSGWTTPMGSAMNIRLQAPSLGACRPSGAVTCLNVVVAPGGMVRSCDPGATAGSSTACN